MGTDPRITINSCENHAKQINPTHKILNKIGDGSGGPARLPKIRTIYKTGNRERAGCRANGEEACDEMDDEFKRPEKAIRAEE